MEHALDVFPVADVEFGRFAEGRFDEVFRVLLGGDEEAFGDERGDRADVLLVQVEDVGASGGLGLVGDSAGAEFEVAAPGAGHGTAGGGVVHEIDGLLLAAAGEVEGKQGAQLDAGGEPSFEGLAAVGERFEGRGGSGQRPDLVGGDEASIALLFLDEAGNPEEGKQVAGFSHRGQHRREEGVGDGGGLADAGEALEGRALAH